MGTIQRDPHRSKHAGGRPGDYRRLDVLDKQRRTLHDHIVICDSPGYSQLCAAPKQLGVLLDDAAK